MKFTNNPVSLPILIEWVERQNLPCLHHSISKTWGEPLLHAPFLLIIFTSNPLHHWFNYIPGDWGTSHDEQLAMILPYLDFVSFVGALLVGALSKITLFH